MQDTTPTLAHTYIATVRPARSKAEPTTMIVPARNVSEARKVVRAAGQVLVSAVPARSWKVASLMRGESGPSYDGMRYKDWQDADDAASCLLWRSTMMSAYYVEPSGDAPNA